MALRRAASVLLRTRLRVPVTSPARKALINPLLPPPRRHFSPRPPTPPPVPATAAAVAEAAEEAFEAARSTNGMLAAFSRLEAAVPANDKRLALACLKLGQHLEASGSADASRVLALALRCLGILEASPNAASPASASDAVSLAMALNLAGSASFDLSRFHDALSFLSRALRLLAPLLPDGGVAFGAGEEPGGFDVRPVAHAVRLQLANVKTALGRREEALADMRACLDLKESILPPGSRELGVAYRDLAEAYATLLDFKQALPFCQKALELHESTLGKNSVEVAHDRRLLGVIYTGLEQHEQALEQNEISQKVMKSWGAAGPDLLHAEIDAANIKIALGKFDEAVIVLKNVAKQVEKDSEMRALVFISMAKALANQEKVGDTKRCLEIACDILEKKEFATADKVAEMYIEVSSLYEMVNEFDKAISLLKRSLGMLERIPQAQHLEGNVAARIGWLLLLTRKVTEAVPYLEDAVERMKDSFGPKHYGVGYVYNNLGAAYMEMDRPQSAAQMFALAKEVMDVSLGPHHSDTIEACQSLAKAYDAMGSYPLAPKESGGFMAKSWRQRGQAAEGGGDVRTGPAERAAGVALEPGVDAAEVEDVEAGGQHPDPVALLELAEAHGALARGSGRLSGGIGGLLPVAERRQRPDGGVLEAARLGVGVGVGGRGAAGALGAESAAGDDEAGDVGGAAVPGEAAADDEDVVGEEEDGGGEDAQHREHEDGEAGDG